MTLALRAALCIGLLAGLAGPARAQEPPPPTITVTGTGAVITTPDILRISVGVQAEAEAASDAIRTMSEGMEAMLATLSEAGIAGADIQTAGLTLSPRYADSYSSAPTPQVDAFVASTDATIVVRDLTAAGRVLDAVVAAGATQIYGLSFDSSNRAALTDQARSAAVADAIAKTTLYASAASLTPGRIVSISEAGGGGGGPMFDMATMEAREVPIAAGTFTISAQVTVVTAVD